MLKRIRDLLGGRGRKKKAAAKAADQLRVLDARGEVLPLNTFLFDRRRLRASVEILDGRSEVMAVTDDADVAELLRDGEVVRRLSLSWVRGEVTLIR